MPESFVKCLQVQETLLVLAQSCTFLSLASGQLVIYIDHFYLVDLAQLSQIPINNTDTKTGRNHFVR